MPNVKIFNFEGNPLGERELSDAKQAELSDGFERIENEKIGVGRHEQFHQMLARAAGSGGAERRRRQTARA